MSKARDLADFISTGSILSDGTIESTEISGVTADATEINKLDGLTADTTELNTLDGVTATTAELNKLAGTTATTSDFDKLSNVTASATELNYMTGATSSIQSQLDNISVTSGSLTKSFTNGESATITLAQSITPAPVVQVTKEIPQSGVSSKGNWDVDATASNYDLHNTAYSTTLTPSNASADGTFTLGTGSFASTDVGKQIEGNGGVAILTATDGSYSIVTNFTDTSAIASGSWSMSGIKSAGASTGLSIAGLATSGDYSVIESANGHVATRGTGNHISGGNQGMFIGNNGTRLYVVNTYGSDDSVYQWEFGTAWDLSTVPQGATASFYFGSNDGGPVDIHFKPDGTVMYMAGQDNDRCHQYNLSTPWAVNTASHNGSFSVYGTTRVNGGLNGFYFKPDGTRFWTVCRNTDRVTEWAMSTAWDLTTGSYVQDINIGSIDTYPIDIQFSTDGLTCYIAGDNDKFRKWNLQTAWDFSTGTHDTTFNKTIFLGVAQASASGGFYIDDDETKLYINNSGYGSVYQFDIGSLIQPTSQYHIGVTNSSGQIDSQYWTDINSMMTADQSLGDGEAYYAVSTDDRTTWSVAKGSDGVRPIVRDNAGTWQYNTAFTTVTGYGISNASYDNKSFTPSPAINSLSVAFKTDGTKMFTLDLTAKVVARYSLSTAWDVSTATADSNTFSVSGQANSDPYEIAFKSDGTKLFVLDAGLDTIYQYSLSTAWDLSTASYDSVSFAFTSQSTQPYGFVFSGDGTKLYMANASNKYINQYSLSTAWDLSTISYDSKYLDLNSEFSTNGLYGITINGDGTRVYAATYSEAYIYQYNLSTAYDISTATYSNTFFDVSGQVAPTSMFFKPDGHKLYTTGFVTDTIYQYSTTESSYGTSTTWTNATTNDEFYALQQALGATEFNRMDKTQLDAIPDGSHFTLGNTLDLMIALKQDTASTTTASSDGVTINYDAATINQGAVLGTDYDFDFPANNKVRITSNAAQNLKIRVV